MRSTDALRKLAGTSWRRRWLALEAGALLLAAKAMIHTLPFRRWKAAVGPVGDADGHEPRDARSGGDREVLARELAAIVRMAAATLPVELLCLPQALAARWMLRRRGLATRLHVGAKRDGDAAEVQLHAWLEYDGIVLTGRRSAGTFTEFVPGASVDLRKCRGEARQSSLGT